MNKHWTDKSKGMNNLADRIAGLSPAKRALIELRLKKKEPVVSGEQRIPQREKRSSAPLSFAQQRLWFLNQLGTGSAYNIPLAIRLKGLPNIKALEESLNDIIRRHEALRTTFRADGGRPVQVIAENISFKMPLIDLSGKPKADREVEAERLTRDEAMRRFDLVKGPLFNAALIRLSEEEHILLLTMHHIVSDGWSRGVFTSELAALYKAYCNGEASPLPALPIQYADFAHWQREWLQGEVLENQLSYWRKQLEGVPVLQLPTDHPRPAVQTYRGARQSFLLSATLTESLNALSQAEGATLFMTLLAAFNTLLYRYTGQEDIVVGSPIANRNRTEIEGLIGFFVNSLAMRTNLSGNPSFLELLGRIGEVAFGAFEHQDLPFEKLVEELHPQRDMSRTPLFQIMFIVQNMPAEELQLPGLTLSSIAIERITVHFDIEIHLREKPEGLSGRVVYNTDLFDDATIARLMGHYETLLESIVANPNQRISDVQILTDTERQQMLVDWNDTSSKYPRDRCVHQLFEQQVEQSPDAVAVVYGDEQLTYRELNARANQLAHYLEKLGVGPEVLVGICLERCVEMVIAVLGILKAGGAYVPLDPEYPQERLAFMLADTQTPVLLTQQKLLSGLPETAARLVCLDSQWEAIGQESRENPDSDAVAENLAYVMYTSGSTGRPKGVCVTHRNVVRLVKTTNYASLGAEEVFLQFAPISFDASTLELWGPLLNGGRLVVFPVAMPSLAQFGEVIEQHQVTTLWLTAGLFHQMVEDHLDSMGSVRQLLAGGDVLSVPHVKRVLEQLDGCCLINGYGPTENTTFTTCYPMTDVSALGSSVPIGRPIGNTRVYILDAQLQPVPIGVAGQLYTGGDGLARGYLNRPELTAEKFISDPFSEDPAARLYKTGDLARYLPDGNIEFMGRIDHQVKIRGFRIELGEIELVLGQHPAVEEAVVIAREDVPGDKRLVAYVVASHESTPTFSEMRSFLKEKLPDYMIPTALVFLDLLPLTPNGKVDRRALPAPDRNRSQPAEALVAPRDELELQLTKIWEKVLGVKNIGMKDNFFDLGGHSLLAVSLFAQIQKIFGKDLPLTTLFQAPTVEQLACIIRQEGFTTPWSSLVPIYHGGSKPPFFCIHGCSGKVLYTYHLARLLGQDYPLYGLNALGLEKGQVPHDKIEDMAAHYIKEIRTIQFNGPYFISGSGAGCTIALEMAHQLESQGQKVALIVLMSPAPLKPIILSTKLHTYYRYLYWYPRIYFRLLNILIKSRPRIPLIKSAFFNRVLWPWKIFHRFIPIEIHRFHRFLDALGRARLSYTPPQAYHGRITCFLREEFSHDHKKAIGDWYEIAVGGLDIRFVQGTILSMWQEPHVQILAEQLKACLDDAQTDG